MNPQVTFLGFGERALPFLKALGFHQSREWFHDNKDIYEPDVKTPLGDLIEAVSDRFEEIGLPLRGNRKTSLYRINRDIRFSKNKDPYKTHVSAILTRSGTKKDNGFVYVQMSNERSFIASGFYALESTELRGLRELIAREPDKMATIVAAMKDHGLALDVTESLKRTPRGFEQITDEAVLGWVKLKHFVFVEEIDNNLVTTPELADKMFELGKISMPFLEFGWRAIDPLRQDQEKA